MNIHQQIKQASEVLKAELPGQYQKMIEARRQAWKGKCQRLYGLKDDIFKQSLPLDISAQGKQTHGDTFPCIRRMIYEGIAGLYNDHMTKNDLPF